VVTGYFLLVTMLRPARARLLSRTPRMLSRRKLLTKHAFPPKLWPYGVDKSFFSIMDFLLLKSLSSITPGLCITECTQPLHNEVPMGVVDQSKDYTVNHAGKKISHNVF
jgi:hypothetical protein